MPTEKTQELLDNIVVSWDSSPEDFFDKLTELLTSLGMSRGIVTQALEPKSWDHTEKSTHEWEKFLSRYKRLLTRTCSDLELHVKVYKKIVVQLYGDDIGGEEEEK